MYNVKQGFQVKQLYVLITDEDCHDYLVPKEQAEEVYQALEDAEYDRTTYNQTWDWYNETVEGILGKFERLEGEEVYVVKPEDVEEK